MSGTVTLFKQKTTVFQAKNTIKSTVSAGKKGEGEKTLSARLFSVCSHFFTGGDCVTS